MPKRRENNQKYPPLPNKRGAAYAGRIAAPSRKDIETEIEEIDQALAKFKNHIREFSKTPKGISPIVPDHVARLMHRRHSLVRDLILQNLPETDRRTYLPDLDRHIESLHRLTDQLEAAKANQIPELIDLLTRHSRRLSTKIQQLSLRNQPLGTPELGELPERPLAGPIRLDPLPQPTPGSERQRSRVRNLRRR